MKGAPDIRVMGFTYSLKGTRADALTVGDVLILSYNHRFSITDIKALDNKSLYITAQSTAAFYIEKERQIIHLESLPGRLWAITANNQP